MAESTRTLRKFKKETLERATAEKKLVDRERNLIILLNDWFQKCGYCSHAQKYVYAIKQYNHNSQHRFINTSATLQRTWARSNRLVAADNVDLELIVQVITNPLRHMEGGQLHLNFIRLRIIYHIVKLRPKRRC